jgi:ADP-ribose pyrophosphatase YjhB (NUDIX family)
MTRARIVRVQIKLVADVALTAADRVAFVRYADTSKYDGERGWFLPDDYLAHGEHPDDAARRIAREQVGLDADVRLAEIESFANGAWHLIFHYVAAVAEAAPLARGPNVAAAEWHARDALPPAEDVAHHGWALEVLERVLPAQAAA